MFGNVIFSRKINNFNYMYLMYFDEKTLQFCVRTTIQSHSQFHENRKDKFLSNDAVCTRI